MCLMVWAGILLDLESLAGLLFSIGLSFDCTAHIEHSFTTQIGDFERQACGADRSLSHFAADLPVALYFVLNAGFSVKPSGRSQSYKDDSER